MHSTILPFTDWPLVAPMVREFGNKMPEHAGRATFLTAFDEDQGDRLAGFVHIESLFHFVNVYVAPEYEETGLSMRLINDAAACIPEGHSGIWWTKRNVDHIAAQVGARNAGTYRIYRKDR